MPQRLDSSKRWQLCLRCLKERKDDKLYNIAKKLSDEGRPWRNPMDEALYCRMHMIGDFGEGGLNLCVPCSYRLEHAVLGQITGDTRNERL